jgi:hypothetical protein
MWSSLGPISSARSPFSGGQILVNRLGCPPPGTHRQNDRGTSGNNVAAGKDAFARCTLRIESAWMYPRLSVPSQAWCSGQSDSRWCQPRSRPRTRNFELRTGNRHRPPPSRSIRLAQFHALAADCFSASPCHRQKFDRDWSASETRCLPARACFTSSDARRHLRFAAAVKHIRLCALPGARPSGWRQAPCCRRRLRLHSFRASRA